MKLMSSTFLVFIISSIAFGSSKNEIGTPDPEDIEYPDDEAPSKAEIELGKTLYFDTRLSKNHNQSCATCHNPDLGFGDGKAFGLSTHGKKVGRNAPHIYNLGFSSVFMWDGRFSSLEEQAIGPIEAAGEMDMRIGDVLHRLKKVPYYRNQFKKIYKSDITKENLAKAIASFERSIVSNNSPFDKYLKGEKHAMSPAAIRGMDLFKNRSGR